MCGTNTNFQRIFFFARSLLFILFLFRSPGKSWCSKFVFIIWWLTTSPHYTYICSVHNKENRNWNAIVLGILPCRTFNWIFVESFSDFRLSLSWQLSTLAQLMNRYTHYFIDGQNTTMGTCIFLFSRLYRICSVLLPWSKFVWYIGYATHAQIFLISLLIWICFIWMNLLLLSAHLGILYSDTNPKAQVWNG